MTTALGLVAGTLTTVAFIPQLLLVVRTRSAKDISLGMFIIFSVGVFLWMIYGIINHDVPVILANAITLGLALVILWFKITLR
ncbi:MAG: SemiSWEET transporter [Deltaproteobacteria bacterium]|nr:SemiSWEET transporter [Deltaproteobacteria bacterium]